MSETTELDMLNDFLDSVSALAEDKRAIQSASRSQDVFGNVCREMKLQENKQPYKAPIEKLLRFWGEADMVPNPLKTKAKMSNDVLPIFPDIVVPENIKASALPIAGL
jgi:hypothetical protein